MTWTDEREKALERLWTDGLSASQIALELGGGVTRRGVLGKIHRLGLSGRKKPVERHPPRPRQKCEKPKRSNALLFGAPQNRQPAPTPPRQPDLSPVVELRPTVDLLGLTGTTCRWPIGDIYDDDFGYCGRDVADGKPYCAAHCKIAYQSLAKRRKAEAT